MAKLIKGYYKDGVWYEYGGKLYSTVGYNTNGSMTQKAITDILGSVMEVVSGYSMVVRVHGDASCSNLAPFYFVVDGDAFTMTITYNQPAVALDVTITMGGTDITSTAYDAGVINIASVTDNVVITVETSTVTKTNMFTKRTTAEGDTVLNPTALLKSIRGNTLVWRQLWSTANASTNSSICSLSHTDEELVLTATGNSSSTSAKLNAYIANLGITGHIFYVRAEVYIETTTTVDNGHFGMGWVSSSSTTSGGNTNRPKNEWFTVESRTEIETAKTLMLAGVNGNKWLGNGTNKIHIKNLIVADLTAMFGAGNEPTAAVFSKLFPSQYYAYNSSASAKSNVMTNYVSKDEDEETLQNVALDVTALTGKLNGSGESVTIFANGMKSSCNEAINDTYDEIKQVDGVWKAFKRCGDTWASNQISGKGEWNILSEEEVYILDNQTIPTELTVGNGGTEQILPANGDTPSTAPAIMEIQYGATS